MTNARKPSSCEFRPVKPIPVRRRVRRRVALLFLESLKAALSEEQPVEDQQVNARGEPAE